MDSWTVALTVQESLVRNIHRAQKECDLLIQYNPASLLIKISLFRYIRSKVPHQSYHAVNNWKINFTSTWCWTRMSPWVIQSTCTMMAVMLISGSHSLTKTPDSGPGSPDASGEWLGLRHNIVMLHPTRGSPHTRIARGWTPKAPSATDKQIKPVHSQVIVNCPLSIHNIKTHINAYTVLNLIF